MYELVKEGIRTGIAYITQTCDTDTFQSNNKARKNPTENGTREHE